jgi:hypothetical protein
MKAIVQDRYGSADVLEFRDIDDPVMGEDDVLVRVHAAGAGPDVWHIMAGMPYIARPAIGFRGPKIPVRGWDVAGTVEAVGVNVTAFRPGDERSFDALLPQWGTRARAAPRGRTHDEEQIRVEHGVGKARLRPCLAGVLFGRHDFERRGRFVRRQEQASPAGADAERRSAHQRRQRHRQQQAGRDRSDPQQEDRRLPGDDADP